MKLTKLTFRVRDEAKDALSSLLMDAGAGALEEGPGSLSAYVEQEELLRDLLNAKDAFNGNVETSSPEWKVSEVTEEILDESWQSSGSDCSVQLTDSFTMIPSDDEESAPVGADSSHDEDPVPSPWKTTWRKAQLACPQRSFARRELRFWRASDDALAAED